MSRDSLILFHVFIQRTIISTQVISWRPEIKSWQKYFLPPNNDRWESINFFSPVFRLIDPLVAQLLVWCFQTLLICTKNYFSRYLASMSPPFRVVMTTLNVCSVKLNWDFFPFCKGFSGIEFIRAQLSCHSFFKTIL